jgi:type I restriction enzyme S subunit
MKYRLGDICSITKGATGIMKAIPGPYTMIALGETDKTHNEFQFDAKAVIIPLVSSTGHGHASMKRVKYCEGKFALGNILCAVIPNDENLVLAKYLHIYLHWNREELLVSQMKGMANVSLPLNRIADVMVTVPSIEKQIEIIELEKRLVERELEVDELFADQLTQLGNLNLAILKEAVQGRLVNQDPKVEPASELLKRIKSEKATLRQAQGKGKKEKTLPPIKTEEIPFEIPESWVWCRFQEITHLITCGLASTPKYYPSGRIFLSAKNVKPFRFIPYEFKYVDEETYRKVTQNAKPELEDILITRVGAGIGETAVIDKEIDFAFYVSLTLVKPVKIGINSSYLSYWLNSTFGIQNAIEHTSGKGSNQGNLNVNRVRTFMIPLPPLSEQKRIVAEIEKQFAKTKQLKEHILANQQDTEQLLKALLHQAFEVRESETV